jgi:hypothetical protein
MSDNAKHTCDGPFCMPHVMITLFVLGGFVDFQSCASKFLLGEFNTTGLTDHGDPYLTGILEFVLDSASQLS